MKIIFDLVSCLMMVIIGLGLIYASALQLADVFIWIDDAQNQFYLAIFASLGLASLGTYWAVKRLKKLL